MIAYERRDIIRRDKIIIRLYVRGIPRKQISYHIDWTPRMSYEAVKKVIQRERRKVPRSCCPHLSPFLSGIKPTD